MFVFLTTGCTFLGYAPRKIELLTPISHSYLDTTNISLLWECEDADSFDLYIYTPLFNENYYLIDSLILNDTNTIKNDLFIPYLKSNSEYSWYVVAKNDYGHKVSNTFEFITYFFPQVPAPSEPYDGKTNESTSIYFIWFNSIWAETPDGIFKKNFQLSKDSLFTEIVIDTFISEDETYTNSDIFVQGLDYNTWYYWRIKTFYSANGYETSSPWSVVYKVQTHEEWK